MSYLTSAYERLLADLPKPQDMPLNPNSDAWENHEALISATARAMDEYLAALFREAQMSGASIAMSEHFRLVSTAIHDQSDIGAINDEMERAQVEESEARSDPRGYAQAAVL